MAKKATYRIKNWKAYNRSLINRGNLTVWFDDDAVAAWHNTKPTGRKGRTPIFSDSAIETALVLRSLFHLPLRQTQGLIDGLVFMLDLKIDVPSYATLSRRAVQLNIDLSLLASRSPTDLVIDATGLKVYGEGEWKVRTHGKDKRRTWRKLHLGIDRTTHEIAAITLTESNVHDSTQTAALLTQVKKLASVTGDKGYDNKNAYDPIAARHAMAIIPPRSGAALKTKNLTWGDVQRNRLVRENHLLGKSAWKVGSGYSRRSLVETGIGRYKQILGPTLHSRAFERQKVEVRLGAKILNTMVHLGMPKSYKL